MACSFQDPHQQRHRPGLLDEGRGGGLSGVVTYAGAYCLAVSGLAASGLAASLATSGLAAALSAFFTVLACTFLWALCVSFLASAFTSGLAASLAASGLAALVYIL